MGSWRVALVAVALAGGAGCSTIDTHTAPDPTWPELRIVEHRVDAGRMWERCRPYVGPLAWPLACAEINLIARRCDIWLTEEPAGWIVEHERLHCAGYDHPGSTHLRDMWRAYVAGQAGAAAARHAAGQ